MDFEYITSKENKLVKLTRKLISSAKERRENGMFVLEGLRLCADAALNGYEIDTLIVSENILETERLDEIKKAAKHHVKMPESLFNSLCDTVSPQGVICLVKIPKTIGDLCDISKGKFIVLENTADPANLGTIARTAEALGISGIIMSSGSCDPFSPKAQRAGMGALLRLPIYICKDFLSDIGFLKSKGISCFASVVSNADCDISDVDFSENMAVFIGNEANGLSADVISLCDKKVTISMLGRAESLNAAAAASIFMWEMMKVGDK